MDIALRSSTLQTLPSAVFLLSAAHYPQYKDFEMNVGCLPVSMEALPQAPVHKRFPGILSAPFPSDLCPKQMCCLFTLLLIDEDPFDAVWILMRKELNLGLRMREDSSFQHLPWWLASFVRLLFKFWNLWHVKVKSADLALKQIKTSQIGKTLLSGSITWWGIRTSSCSIVLLPKSTTTTPFMPPSPCLRTRMKCCVLQQWELKEHEATLRNLTFSTVGLHLL